MLARAPETTDDAQIRRVARALIHEARAASPAARVAYLGIAAGLVRSLHPAAARRLTRLAARTAPPLTMPRGADHQVSA